MLFCVTAALTLIGLAQAAVITKRQGITTLSSSQIEAFKPFSLYAAAAYCNPSATLSWSCGDFCEGNPSFQPFASGGDGSATQFWFVGWDASLNSVIVAHQGTNPTQFLADLTDVDFFLANLDSTLFPGLSSSIQVHNGFAAEQAKTATTILSAVETLLSQHGSTSVTVTGHSLGAALALLDAVYLPLHLPQGTSVKMIGYGLPRVGNPAFAAYVDATAHVTHINNEEDPVPIVPGRFLGFAHPAGEVHIQDSRKWVSCPGEDNTSTSCTVGDVPNVIESDLVDHLGPYDDNIFMGLC
ncbi:alpha/beta-hydrolase [Gloeopeniophorella convolvens]|nr:alpha/beta-hydrolase [Gloeopeniophorella convolvens]